MTFLPLILIAGAVAFAVALAAAPIRRRRGVSVTLTIRAERATVWRLLLTGCGPYSWRPEVVSVHKSPRDPDLIEQVIEYRGRRISAVFRILSLEAEQELITRCDRVGRTELPLGATAFAAIKLVDVDAGVRLQYREEGDFASIATCLVFWLSQRSAFRRLKRDAERQTRSEFESRRLKPPFRLVAGSAVAALAITTVAGWQFGVLVFAMAVVMEYGHTLVLRWGGARPPVTALLPFVGGALVMSWKPTDALGQAVRALSGPAALTLMLLALVVAEFLAGTGAVADNSRLAAGTAAGLLALFLLPLYPFNGGWLLATLRGTLPEKVFLVPALVASTSILAWSFYNGAILAAALAAALIYDLAAPRRERIACDGSVSSRQALVIIAAYAGMNLLAHMTFANSFFA